MHGNPKLVNLSPVEGKPHLKQFLVHKNLLPVAGVTSANLAPGASGVTTVRH